MLRNEEKEQHADTQTSSNSTVDETTALVESHPTKKSISSKKQALELILYLILARLIRASFPFFLKLMLLNPSFLSDEYDDHIDSATLNLVLYNFTLCYYVWLIANSIADTTLPNASNAVAIEINQQDPNELNTPNNIFYTSLSINIISSIFLSLMAQAIPFTLKHTSNKMDETTYRDLEDFLWLYSISQPFAILMRLLQINSLAHKKNRLFPLSELFRNGLMIALTVVLLLNDISRLRSYAFAAITANVIAFIGLGLIMKYKLPSLFKLPKLFAIMKLFPIITKQSLWDAGSTFSMCLYYITQTICITKANKALPDNPATEAIVLLTTLHFAIALGLKTWISRYINSKNNLGNIKRTIGYAMMLALIVTATFFIGTFFFAGNIINLFYHKLKNHSEYPELFAEAKSALLLRAISNFPSALAIIFQAAMRAIGNNFAPLQLTAFTSIVYTLLSFFLFSTKLYEYIDADPLKAILLLHIGAQIVSCLLFSTFLVWNLKVLKKLWNNLETNENPEITFNNVKEKLEKCSPSKLLSSLPFFSICCRKPNPPTQPIIEEIEDTAEITTKVINGTKETPAKSNDLVTWESTCACTIL